MSLAPPSRLADLVIAMGLCAAAVAVLVATNDMGFVRDEAFYFAHAEGYQGWFVDVEEGGAARAKALTRNGTLDVWRQNAEHPPLDKILFGWSWRAFGRKLRPVGGFGEGANPRTVEVRELGPAHGFAKGAAVTILRPQPIGGSAAPDGRALVTGVVIDRNAWRAVVELPVDASPARLRAACPDAGPPGSDGAAGRRTGCEALERRATYWLSESAAMRLPGALFAGLLVALIYLAGRMWFASRMTAAGPGTLARPFALAAAVGYLCLPQPFWHAHLCTFDTTIVALLFATTVCWHRAVHSRPWVTITALTWGFALLAKHNALFLPIPLICHWLFHAGAERRIVARWDRSPKVMVAAAAVALACGALGGVVIHPLVGLAAAAIALAAGGLRLELPPVPRVFFAMIAIGPLVLIGGWPLLWHDTFDNLLRWIEFHLHHEHYMQVFFGRVLAYPPFPAIFPWAMTVFTWPLTLLAPVAIGLVAVYLPRRVAVPPPLLEVERHDAWLFADRTDDARRTAEQRSWDRLVLLSAIWPILLISLPGTPIFGGTKHWMPAYPFLLLIGARGVQAMWRVLLHRHHDALGAPGRVERAAAWALSLLLLIPAAIETRSTYAHGSAYYNALIGGLPGAAQAGMQRQFWGGATREGLEEVNARAPAGSNVWFHKSAWGAWQMYNREGWFRRDLRYWPNPEGSQVGFFHHQKDHDDYETDLYRDYRATAPVWQFAIDGVELLSVYERPPVAQPASPRLP